MTYRLGILAMKVGSACLNQKAAARLARASGSCSDIGRKLNTAANDCSVAKISEATFRYFSALRRPSVAISASTWTRKSTNSALGGGSGSTAVSANSNSTDNSTDPTQRPHARKLNRPTVKLATKKGNRGANSGDHPIGPGSEFARASNPRPQRAKAGEGTVAALPGHPSERHRARQTVSIRETEKPCQARLAVLPYRTPKLAGFDRVHDRCCDVLHVLNLPSLRVQQ